MGRVLHAARGYDWVVWLFTRGREGALRERMLRLARLEPGEIVLDVGCGTGTLAIAAKRQVGTTGVVCGIDASPAMTARAANKAKKARSEVEFKAAVVEALPFPDARFDVVLSTMMMHHLPRQVRQQAFAEIRRVLKPGGRILVVDFARPQQKRGVLAHFHRHGHVDFEDVTAMLREAGLEIADRGPVGFSSLQFVLASPPGAQVKPPRAEHSRSTSTRGWLGAVPIAIGVVTLAAAHLIVPVTLSYAALSAAALLAIVVVLVLAHVGVVTAAVSALRARVIRRPR